jgi:hypothetical protein
VNDFRSAHVPVIQKTKAGGIPIIPFFQEMGLRAGSRIKDDIYWIRGAKSIAPQEALKISSKDTRNFDLRHNRLGHVNKDKILIMISKTQLENKHKASGNDPCIDCSSGRFGNQCGVTGGRDRPSSGSRASAPVAARRAGVPAVI